MWEEEEDEGEGEKEEEQEKEKEGRSRKRRKKRRKGLIVYRRAAEGLHSLFIGLFFKKITFRQKNSDCVEADGLASFYNSRHLQNGQRMRRRSTRKAFDSRRETPTDGRLGGVVDRKTKDKLTTQSADSTSHGEKPLAAGFSSERENKQKQTEREISGISGQDEDTWV